MERPAQLASDTTQNHDVALNVLDSLPIKPDITVLLQPTSPLRDASDIDACINMLLNDKTINCAITVCMCEHHPAKALTMKNGLLAPFGTWTDAEARRQTLPEAYRQNGAVYAIRSAIFMQERRFLIPPVAAHIMPAGRSVDIDTEADLNAAEKLVSSSIKSSL